MITDKSQSKDSTPARMPITSMMITITIRMDSIRLMMNPLLASWAITFSGYKGDNEDAEYH